MTFEEIKTELDSGGGWSEAELAEMIRALNAQQKSAGVYIAIALYESRKLWKGKGWAFHAAETFNLTDDKLALHRACVGEMLRALGEYKPGKLPPFMEQGISLLDQWARLFVHGKRLLALKKVDHACIPLLNFQKSHADAFSWKRERLSAEIARAVNPEKEFVQQELNLKFDVIGAALEDEDLAKITSREDFDGIKAFIMANNGAKLCTHALNVILKDNDALPADALKDIDSTLENAHRQLRAMLRARENREV